MRDYYASCIKSDQGITHPALTGVTKETAEP